MGTATLDPTITALPTPPRRAPARGSKLPPLVQIAQIARDPIGAGLRAHARFGEPYAMRVPGFAPSLVFSSPELVRQVVTGRPSSFLAGVANRPLAPVLGRWSLLTLDRAPHMSQRKLLLPPFHGERLRDLAEREVAGWPLGRPFRLDHQLERLTLEVILDVVFGISDEGRKDALRRLLPPLVASSRRVVFWGPLANFDLGPIRLRQTFLARQAAVDELLRAEVAARRREPAAVLDARRDILSMLVQATHEDGSPMGDEELRDELITLVMAGHETTATALTWAVDLLLRNPAAHARMRAAGAEGDAEWVNALCQEVLRIRPVVPFVARVLSEPARIGDVDCPAGIALTASIATTHHRPDVFPSPSLFRPERFLGDEAPPSYAWLPFGGGVRRCIGASFAQFEMATILRVLARADVRLAVRRPEPVRATGVTLVPGRGVRLVREHA
ncbi:cytochrome P450 [Conexibacter sp. JD483]|uniref:cytochrome P450 n=1 Tax=unclassified Conexibacter TaxID=2627773 RepID=UPI00271D2C26|nr:MULTISPECIES: cytochrome P450 [unclassified Conexibacter]MDO8187643.1 cytochrome P450 [Conexibacter sp. CPCC 205706]MDO8201025.1 cytochrome P450 [Conexibacter sp. CPCC 205762]MDR9371198.1 cytochrome P450 [Conexibacter sp. JD483]